MFLITLDGKEDEGAYSVLNQDGKKVIFFFQEEDDAVRYAIMLEEQGMPETHVIEYDDDILIKTCEVTGNLYTVITPNDIVVPPKIHYDNF
jgi:hypothetical protein